KKPREKSSLSGSRLPSLEGATSAAWTRFEASRNAQQKSNGFQFAVAISIRLGQWIRANSNTSFVSSARKFCNILAGPPACPALVRGTTTTFVLTATRTAPRNARERRGQLWTLAPTAFPAGHRWWNWTRV